MNLLCAVSLIAGNMRGIVEVVGGDDVRHIADNAVTAAFVGLTPEAMKNKLGSELGEPKEILRTWVTLYNESMQMGIGRPVTHEYQDARGDQVAWLTATVSYLGTPPHGDPDSLTWSETSPSVSRPKRRSGRVKRGGTPPSSSFAKA